MISRILSGLYAFGILILPNARKSDLVVDRPQVIRDLFAGATVAIALIPQACAYALLLGLPPVNGLYAALFGVVVGALWGSSRQMITGPVGVMSLLAVAALLPYAEQGPERLIVLAASLAVMVGLIQLALGASRLGFLMRLVPRSVLDGFSAGAGVVIAITQLPALLGFSASAHQFMYQSMFAVLQSLADTHLLTAGVAACSVASIMFLRGIFGKSFPAALITMISAIAASWVFDFQSHGIAVVGSIPVAFPSLGLVQGADVLRFGMTAFAMALIGFLGSYSIAKSIAVQTREKIDVDQELVGQGLANIVSGLFRGYPVGGSFSISTLNHDAGGRTPLVSITAGILIIIAIVCLTPLFALLPKAVLGAVVIVSALSLVRPRELRSLYGLSRADGVIALLTFASAVLVQPQDAVMIGVVVALLYLIGSVMRADVPEVGIDPEWNVLQTVRNNPQVEVIPGVVIIRIDRDLVYANAERVEEQVLTRVRERRERTGERVRLAVLNCAGVNSIDASGIDALREIEHRLGREDVRTAVLYIKHDMLVALERSRLSERITRLHNIQEIRGWVASE